MNMQIVMLLGQDGVTNGAVYALLALSIMLVFSVTRILLIPQGEFVAFAALTMAAMQSGRAKATDWVLEFEPASARRSDPLMGWTLTNDMDGQIRLAFETKDEAVAYAQAHGIAFQISDPKPAKRIIKAYADNFAFGRKQPWTH